MAVHNVIVDTARNVVRRCLKIDWMCKHWENIFVKLFSR